MGYADSANTTPATQMHVGMGEDGVPYRYEGAAVEPKSTFQRIKDGVGNFVEGALHAAEGIPGEGLVVGGLAKAGVSAEQAIQRVIISGAKQVQAEASVIEQGGLNLFKWGSQTTTTSTGWRAGDFMLHLPNRGSVRANWAQNSGRLREQMSKGQPIYDSFRDASSGLQIPTKGFLGAERNLLESRGWQYNPAAGAYYPPLP